MGRRRTIAVTAATVLGTVAVAAFVLGNRTEPANASSVAVNEPSAAEAAPQPVGSTAEIDPAALYDPPTVDVDPPPKFGQTKSAPDWPDITLVTHEGKEVDFYDDLVKGKIVAINLMYATCTGT